MYQAYNLSHGLRVYEEKEVIEELKIIFFWCVCAFLPDPVLPGLFY